MNSSNAYGSLGDNTNSHQVSLFPDIFQHSRGNGSTAPLLPIESSVTPQRYQWHFNNSTNTFIPPLMLSGWDPNSSTNTFVNNDNVLLFPDIDFGDDILMPIPDNWNPSDTINNSENTNHNATSSVVPHTQPKKKKKRSKKIYTCPICNMKLKGSTSFDYHLKTHEPKKKKLYTCNICNKNLTSKPGLKHHIKTHDPNRERPHKCKLCGARFFQKSTLNVHIKRHNKEVHFECDYCSKRFLTKYEKIMHHRTHTGEKPYKCTLCNKGFFRQRDYQNHIKIHAPEKPFQCKECKESFKERNSLKEHLKLHKKEKSSRSGQGETHASEGVIYNERVSQNSQLPLYVCMYCNAGFSYKKKFDDHIRYEESGEDEPKCHICQKAYMSNYTLKQHNKKAHPETVSR